MTLSRDMSSFEHEMNLAKSLKKIVICTFYNTTRLMGCFYYYYYERALFVLVMFSIDIYS